MLIGINAMAAFKGQRTGVEEYAYQLIKHLIELKENCGHQFVLYNHSNTIENGSSPHKILSWRLPPNFRINQLEWGLPMWTQVRLAFELSVNMPDALFIPVHILPRIHPKNSVVAIQGLEYEYYPRAYSKWHLQYLRWGTKYALKKARKIIVPSLSTKKDLVKLYNGDHGKIEVVYHGVEIPNILPKTNKRHSFILFIGRIEIKKNIHRLIKAFELFKEKYRLSHKLILAGGQGYGYEKLKPKIQKSKYSCDIIEKGYVSEGEKWNLLQGADLFAFPSLYEGFGFPILEAQAVGCPVLTSNISSMPEVAGKGAVLVEPRSIESIAEGIYRAINDKELRAEIIEQGRENIKNFTWENSARETLRILTE